MGGQLEIQGAIFTRAIESAGEAMEDRVVNGDYRVHGDEVIRIPVSTRDGRYCVRQAPANLGAIDYRPDLYKLRTKTLHRPLTAKIT